MEAHPSELSGQLLKQREWLQVLARQLVGAGAADDLAQATWVAALERPGRPGELRPWLAGIARNLARGLRRGGGRRERRERRAARAEGLPSTSELVERVDTERRVAEELVALREPYRTTLLLRFHEGLTAQEIARRQGLPASTVRGRVGQGLAELRARLERACGGREALGVALVELAREPAGIALAGTATGGVIAMLTSKGFLVSGACAALAALWIGAVRRRVEGVAPGETGGALGALEPSLPQSVEGQGSALYGIDVQGRRVALEPEPNPESATVRPALARLRILEADGTPNVERLVVLLPAARAGLESQRTDREGWLELPAGVGRREVVIERRSAFSHRALIELAAGERELVLPEGEVLEGRIVVDGGTPARPIALELFPADSARDESFFGNREPVWVVQTAIAPGRTDGEGRFAFRGLQPEQGYNLRLAPGFARPGTRSFSDPERGVRFHVPRAAAGLVFEVERFPSLRGRLVEADGLTPTSGVVECRFTWANGTGMDTGARADEDGYFELFPAEDWREVQLAYWGFPGERGGSSTAFARGEVPADGDLGDLRLAPGRTFVLRVTDPAGRPVARARTDLDSEPTDAHGETRLSDVSAASFRVGARGYSIVEVALPEGGTSELVAVLEPAPALEVEILAAEGVPLGGIDVALSAPQPFFTGPDGAYPFSLLSQEREGSFVSSSRREGRVVARFRAGPAGRVGVDGLKTGIPLRLQVLAQGGAIVHDEPVPALGPSERRSVTVDVRTRVVALHGRVVDARGEPIAGARLALPAVQTPGQSRALWAESDADGFFRTSVLALPDLCITVTKNGYRPLVLEYAVVPEQGLELVLERGRDLGVTVVDEQGEPQLGGDVSVRPAGGVQALAATAVAPGRFETLGLADEPHEVVLSIGGGVFRRGLPTLPAEIEFRVPAMGAVEASWDLAPGGTADGWLHLELRSSAADRMAMSEGFVHTPTGRQRFEPVLPGEYELVLTSQGDRDEVLARRTLVVAAHETMRVDL